MLVLINNLENTKHLVFHTSNHSMQSCKHQAIKSTGKLWEKSKSESLLLVSNDYKQPMLSASFLFTSSANSQFMLFPSSDKKHTGTTPN